MKRSLRQSAKSTNLQELDLTVAPSGEYEYQRLSLTAKLMPARSFFFTTKQVFGPRTAKSQLIWIKKIAHTYCCTEYTRGPT